MNATGPRPTAGKYTGTNACHHWGADYDAAAVAGAGAAGTSPMPMADANNTCGNTTEFQRERMQIGVSANRNSK